MSFSWRFRSGTLLGYGFCGIHPNNISRGGSLSSRAIRET